MNKSKRIFYYDVLRTIAIIGIVFCHASAPFVVHLDSINYSYLFTAAFFDCFRDFSIPIFLMLSGALLLNRNDDLLTFCKKRLSKILLPFIFWVGITILYTFFNGNFNTEALLSVIFGAPNTLGAIYWFIWMILICYIGIFIINKIISWKSKSQENFDKKFINALTILSVAYIIIYEFIFPYPYKLIEYPSFIAYMIIGYFIANSDAVSSKINNKILIISTLILAIVSYYAYISLIVVPNTISSGEFANLRYFNLIILFISANIFLFFKFSSTTDIFKKIENGFFSNLIITKLSQYSYRIYLSHYLVLFSLRLVILYNVMNFTYLNPLLWIPPFVAVTLIYDMTILTFIDLVFYIAIEICKLLKLGFLVNLLTSIKRLKT